MNWRDEMKRALLIVVIGALCMNQLATAQQAPSNALAFFKNYFVAGDYVVGGVGLRGKGVNGTAVGTIPMSGVPANADIVAAYLYWQSMETSADPVSSVGKFRGFDIIGKKIGPDGIAACWGSGGGSGTTSGAATL